MHTMKIEPELEFIELGGVMLDFADIAEISEVITVPQLDGSTPGYQFLVTVHGEHGRPVPSPLFDHQVMAEHSRQALAGFIRQVA